MAQARRVLSKLRKDKSMIRERLRRWRRYRTVVRELQEYGHRELGELGIARNDIARIARAAAEE
jgi:uncharacterized protein YjiS (DUF1127 family)